MGDQSSDNHDIFNFKFFIIFSIQEFDYRNFNYLIIKKLLIYFIKSQLGKQSYVCHFLI